MTIAIGIKASDGLVVAADSEISSGNYMKGAGGKVATFFVHDEGWAESCIVAGAGNSGYVEALINELGQTYQAADPQMQILSLQKKSPQTLQLEFQNCIKRFYKEHIIPFAHYPERTRPDVEVLVACQRKTIMLLLSSDMTVLNYSGFYTGIGYGSMFAQFFLDRLWTGMSVEQAEVMAAYIVFLVKESVETCGKWTTIDTIRGAKIEETPEGSRMIPTREARP